MYRRNYLIAGKRFEISSMYKTVHAQCRDYVCGDDEVVDHAIVTTQAHIDFEKNRSRREAEVEGIACVQYPDAYLETLAVYRQIADYMLEHDTLLFHGSVIAVDGEAYLFTAKSGTGKSTHTRLWREMFGDKAVMINDDKPLICLKDGQAVVYGTPWNGKHGLGINGQAPLKAVCILTRAEENHIVSLPKRDAYPMLLQQSYRPTDPAMMGLTLALIDRLGNAVQLFRLGCNMDPAAARVAYEGMSGRSVEDVR